MAQTSLIIGDTNWAVKEDSLLGYNVIQNNYLPIPIDCVRATTATRVNEQGLIEIVPRNLITYSEQIDNAVWIKTNLTVTSPVATAPNGTLTADKLIPTTTNDLHIVEGSLVSFVSGNSYTFSFYAKRAEDNFIQITASSSLLSTRANFNLLNGTLGFVDSGITATITPINNDWYRCTASFVASTTGNFRMVLCNIPASTSARFATFAGNGTSGLFVWGAQIDNGSVATEYFPTTTRLNIPRIDYSTGTASLLVEPQRTNLALYSEQFNNDAGYISSGRPVITTNIAASPSGLLEADLLTYASGDSLRNTPSFTFTDAYTYSIFVKKDIGRYVTISGLFFTRSLSVGFDLDTKTCQAGGTVTDFGNGWLRLSISQVVTGDADKNGFFYVYAPNSLGVQDSAAGNRFYAWGCQIEEGTYPTSYIPTIASSVTRNTDIISRTGISGLIGQTEGTLFAELNITKLLGINGSRILGLDNGVDVIQITTPGVVNANVIRFQVFISGAFPYVFDYTIPSIGVYKMAFTYKQNDFKVYVNGVLVSTGLSGNIPLSLNNFSPIETVVHGIKSIQLYKTKLTNAECINLTTL